MTGVHGTRAIWRNDRGESYFRSDLQTTSHEVPMSARQLARALTSLALLVVPTQLLAQTGTVSGTITESRANQPVGGARVQALSATTVVAATQSRDDGTYRLTVPAGAYTI